MLLKPSPETFLIWARMYRRLFSREARASQTHCHTTGSTSYVEKRADFECFPLFFSSAIYILSLFQIWATIARLSKFPLVLAMLEEIRNYRSKLMEESQHIWSSLKRHIAKKVGAS